MKFHKPKESKPIDFEAEQDLRALARAKEVEGNPDRMARCRELAKTKLEKEQPQETNKEE